MTLTRRTFIAAAASTAVAPVEALAPAAATTETWVVRIADDLWSRAELEALGQWPPERFTNEQYRQMLDNMPIGRPYHRVRIIEEE
jgi:hypothetical protein